jgi:hypothetical protein
MIDSRLAGVLSAEQLSGRRRHGLHDPTGDRSREELKMEAVYDRVTAVERKAGRPLR